MEQSVYWLQCPAGHLVASVVAMIACGALALLVLGADSVARYLSADQAEPADVPAQFADTHAAIASGPADLSELERLEQLLQPLDRAVLELPVVHLPEPGADGAAWLRHRFDRFDHV